MDGLAAFMTDYAMRGQHTPDRAMTRYRYDIGKMVENNEISTGPGRWALGVPNHYGNAAFVPDPTIRMQRWGASHDMTSTKTDTESDLRNLARPTTRSACGQYSPEQGAARAARLTPMPETAFPRTYERLVDPPCTLRGSGWNRWEWLCENPQERVMMPFEWAVDSRHAAKDTAAATITKPLERSPAAAAHAAICGRVYMEPAVPVARPSALDATDAIGGAATAAAGVGAVRIRNAQPAPEGAHRDYVDAERAATGILAPPPSFATMIAPH
jgi:hypothetical protein